MSTAMGVYAGMMAGSPLTKYGSRLGVIRVVALSKWQCRLSMYTTPTPPTTHACLVSLRLLIVSQNLRVMANRFEQQINILESKEWK
jgi:hypothetical protein